MTKQQVFEELLEDFIQDEKTIIWDYSTDISADEDNLPKVRETWLKRYEAAE